MQVCALTVGLCRCALALEEPRKAFTAIPGAAGEFFLFFFDVRHLGPQQPRLLQQTLVGLASLAEIFRAVPGQDEIPHEIEQQSVEDFKSIGVIHKIPHQHVVLKEKMIVVAAINEKKTILQQLVSLVEIFAEKRPARFRKRALFHIAPNPADRLTDCPVNIFLVCLDFGDL